MLSSGFTHAPVSKVLLFGLLAASTIVSITDSKHLLPIQVVPHLWPYKQVWRLFTWQVCFTLNILPLELTSSTIALLHQFHRASLRRNDRLPHAFN
jgi:hypothetical protein